MMVQHVKIRTDKSNLLYLHRFNSYGATISCIYWTGYGRWHNHDRFCLLRRYFRGDACDCFLSSQKTLKKIIEIERHIKDGIRQPGYVTALNVLHYVKIFAQAISRK